MNTLPCGKCAWYDPILKSNERESKRGWCIKRSIYPAIAGPGQVIPDSAVRADDPKTLGKPFIVRQQLVVEPCAYAKPGEGQAARKRTAQTKLDKAGKRILE